MRFLALLITAIAASPSLTADPKPAPRPEVRHEPLRPKPDVPVLVTARPGPGTTKAVLKVQAVAPGKYVRKSDPAYETDWAELPMRDDGTGGDAKAGDGVFSVRVPASFQRHRWLLRYRVEATGPDGKAARLPAPDDSRPNFARWCDAGPAAWTGARDPGKTPALTFPADFLGTLQTLHLL